MNFKKILYVFLSKTSLLNFALLSYQKFLRVKSRSQYENDLVLWTAKTRIKTLFVDISILASVDHGGGIQRVQKSLLQNWSTNKPKGFEVVPIYYSDLNRRFEFVGAGQLPSWTLSTKMPGEVVKMTQGDIYLNTDLNYRFVIEHEDFYESLRMQSIKVYFIVYDLLPLNFPSYFPEGIQDFHKKWLEAALRNAKLICISNAVADEVIKWSTNKQISVEVESINLGSNLSEIEVSTRETNPREGSLPCMSFLIVSTIEARKGHDQVLNAFELIWSQGIEVSLTFVGKKGWKVDDLIDRIESHRHINRKLFWFNELDDAGLSEVYKNSTALINASFGEGFGLPLIEASAHGLPLILRDIPVFREIAGNNAWYFETSETFGLAKSIIDWMKEFSAGKILPNVDIPIYSWLDTCNQIVDIFKADEIELF